MTNDSTINSMVSDLNKRSEFENVSPPSATARSMSRHGITVGDGDTVFKDGLSYRLIDGDANESSQVLGKDAQAYLQKLIDNAEKAEVRSYGKDKYNRELGRLFLDGKNAMVEMVRAGFAVPYEFEESEFTEAFRLAEQEARKAKLGVWKESDEARIIPGAHRRLSQELERNKFAKTTEFYKNALREVRTPEFLEAEEKRRDATYKPSEDEIRLAPVKNIAVSVANIAGIGFRNERLKVSIDSIPPKELRPALEEMEKSFGYTSEDFVREGYKTPEEAARELIKSAMEIVRTSEERQRAFEQLSDAEKTDTLNEAFFGDDENSYRIYGPEDFKKYSEKIAFSGAIETAFENGASADVVATGVMLALSEGRTEEQHRRRLANMTPTEMRQAVNVASAIRAQYDGNFAMKGLYSLWNSTESVAESLVSFVTGDSVGRASYSRQLDVLASSLEDTQIRVDGLLDEVSTVAGSSLPSMALLLVPYAGIPLYAASSYSEISKNPILEDWHNAEPWRVEALKLTYAAAAPLIEKGVVQLALKPVSSAAKLSGVYRRLPGFLSPKTLAMRLAGAQQKSAVTKITQGLLESGKRSAISGYGGEVIEEGLTQAIMTGGGMFVDPTTADGRKLYNLERFGGDVVDAAWTAIKTGPFVTFPVATLGVGMEYWGIKNGVHPIFASGEIPSPLEYQQSVVNAMASFDAKTNAATIGGLNEQEVASFFVASEADRKALLEQTTDKNKKHWLGELDEYIKIQEDFLKNAKVKVEGETVKPIQASETQIEPETHPANEESVIPDTKSIIEEAEANPDLDEEEEQPDSDTETPQNDVPAPDTNTKSDSSEEAKTEANTEAENREVKKERPVKVEGATIIGGGKAKTKKPLTSPVAFEGGKDDTSSPTIRTQAIREQSKKAIGIAGKAEKKFKKLIEGNGFPTIASSISAAYTEKKVKGVDADLVKTFKKALKEEEKTDVKILKTLASAYSRVLSDIDVDADAHLSFQEDPTAWIEAMLDNIITKARRHKKGDKVALEELNRIYRGDGLYKRLKYGLARVEDHERLETFAKFSKKWLQSVYGDNVDIYFIEDLAESTDKEHKKMYKVFAKNGFEGAIAPSGNVYISRNADVKTVIHEVFGHATWNWMKQNSPAGYEKLKEIAMAAPKDVVDAVRKAYPEFRKPKTEAEEERYLNELFAFFVMDEYASTVDEIMVNENSRSWFEQFWASVKKAVSAVYSFITGIDDEIDPKAFVDSLFNVYIAHRGIEIRSIGSVDPSKYKGRFNGDDDAFGDESGITFDELANVSSEFGQKIEIPEDAVENEEEVDDSEEEPTDEQEAAKRDKERIKSEKEYTEGAADLREELSQNDENEATNPKGRLNSDFLNAFEDETPSTLTSEEDKEDNIYEMRNTLKELTDVLLGALDKIGFDIKGFQKKAKREDIAVAGQKDSVWKDRKGAVEKLKEGDDFNPQNQTIWEQAIDKTLAKQSSNVAREVCSELLDILKVFGGTVLHSRVAYDEETIKMMEDKIASARAILDENKDIAARTRTTISNKIDAVEKLVAFATVNSPKFVAAKSILSGFTVLLRPPMKRVEVPETDVKESDRVEFDDSKKDLSPEDFERYGLDESNIKDVKGLERILQDSTFESVDQDPIRTHIIAKLGKGFFDTWEIARKLFAEHENKYVREYGEEVLNKMQLAWDTANQEYRRMSQEALEQALIDQGMTNEDAHFKAFFQTSFNLDKYIKKLSEKRKDSAEKRANLLLTNLKKLSNSDKAKAMLDTKTIPEAIRILEHDVVKRIANRKEDPPLEKPIREALEKFVSSKLRTASTKGQSEGYAKAVGRLAELRKELWESYLKAEKEALEGDSIRKQLPDFNEIKKNGGKVRVPYISLLAKADAAYEEHLKALEAKGNELKASDLTNKEKKKIIDDLKAEFNRSAQKHGVRSMKAVIDEMRKVAAIADMEYKAPKRELFDVEAKINYSRKLITGGSYEYEEKDGDKVLKRTKSIEPLKAYKNFNDRLESARANALKDAKALAGEDERSRIAFVKNIEAGIAALRAEVEADYTELNAFENPSKGIRKRKSERSAKLIARTPHGLAKAYKENKKLPEEKRLKPDEVRWNFFRGKDKEAGEISIGSSWHGMFDELTNKQYQELADEALDKLARLIELEEYLEVLFGRTIKGRKVSGEMIASSVTGETYKSSKPKLKISKTHFHRKVPQTIDPVEEFKNNSRFHLPRLSAVLLRYMANKKDNVISNQMLKRLSHAYNPYIGGDHLDQLSIASRYIAALAFEQNLNVKEMTDKQLVDLCEELVETLPEEHHVKLIEALAVIQTDTWKAESSRRKAYLDHLEKTGRNKVFAPLSNSKLAQMGVFMKKNKDGKYSLGAFSYQGLNSRLRDYLFNQAEPKRDEYDSDEKFNDAMDVYKELFTGANVLAKYRDTLVSVYGKYATDVNLRRYFEPNTADVVRQLVANMRSKADTAEEIDAYAKQIERVLENDKHGNATKNIRNHISAILSDFSKDLDPRRVGKRRHVSANAYTKLNAAYKASGMTREKITEKIKSLQGEYGKVNKSNEIDILKGFKKFKENAAMAASIQSEIAGYQMMIPYVTMSKEGAKSSEKMQKLYFEINKTIAEGSKESDNHLEAEVKEADSIVSATKAIVDKGRSGTINNNKNNQGFFGRIKGALDSLVVDSFSIKQRLQEIYKYVDDPKDRETLKKLFDEKLNIPISRAESKKNHLELERSYKLCENILEVYGDGDTSNMAKASKIIAELNKPVESLKRFAFNDGKPLSRAQVMNQIAVLSQERVYAPILDIETRIEKGEIKESDLEKGTETLLKRFRMKDEMIQALQELSGGKDLEFIEAMYRYFADLAPKLDEVSVKITGAPITVITDKFFPVRRSKQYASGNTESSRRAVSIIPEFLTPGQYSELDIEESTNILSAFNEYGEQASHFMAFAHLNYRLSSLFENLDWTYLTTRILGPKAARMLKDHVQDICSPKLVFIDNSGTNEIWSILRKFTSIALLGGNVLVALKQTTSVPAFAFEIGWNKLVAAAMKNPFSDEMIKARKLIFNSPQAKLRWGTSFIGVQKDILANPGNSASFATFLSRYMALQRMGDMVPSAFIAPGVLIATKRKLLATVNPETKQMYTEEEAEAAALDATFDMIEKTQQTSRVSNMSHQQRRNPVLSQLWTQFMSSTILFFAHEARAIRDLHASGYKGAEQWKNAGRLALSNHVLIPAMLSGLELAMQWVFTGEEPDEEDLTNFLFLMAGGPIGGLVILGNIFNITQSGRGDATAPAASFIGRLSKYGFKTVSSAAQGDGEKFLENGHKLIKALIPAYRDAFKLYEGRFSEED